MCLSRPQFVAWISTMSTLPGTGSPGSNLVNERLKEGSRDKGSKEVLDQHLRLYGVIFQQPDIHTISDMATSYVLGCYG